MSNGDQSGGVLFSFEDPKDAELWYPINDNVMGGVSNSRLEVTPAGVAVFSGTVSLENNGGFASVRSRPLEADCSGYAGLTLRVRGGGQTYKFCVKTDGNFDGPLYQHPFETRKDEWVEVWLPFEAFKPTFRGRLLTHVGPIDPAEIITLGLMISDKQAGPFRLEIDWIRGDGPPPESASQPGG